MLSKSAIDPELQKFNISLPFTPLILRLSHLPQKLMLHFVKAPGVGVRRVKIDGLPLYVMEPPELALDAPCLLFIHGGGFGYAMSPHHKVLAAKLAAGAGCRVICPDYRLLPQHPYPAARQDVLRAYRWVCQTYPAVKTAVCGDSAGGTLAACLVYDAEKTGLAAPRLQMLLYPVTDATLSTKSMKSNTDTPLWSAKNNTAMWRMYLGKDAGDTAQQASPMQMPLPNTLPDTYLETAELDCLHDEGIAYAQRLQAAGARVDLQQTPAVPHGYDIAQNSKVVEQCMKKRIAALKAVFFA